MQHSPWPGTHLQLEVFLPHAPLRLPPPSDTSARVRRGNLSERVVMERILLAPALVRVNEEFLFELLVSPPPLLDDGYPGEEARAVCG